METLRIKLDQLKSIIPKDDWKYLHIESVENFIFHLNSIKNDRTKKRIENEIGSYLSLVEEELASKKILTVIYKDLFSKKLYSLITFYEDELKFIKKPHYLFTVLCFTILFFVLFKVFNIYIAIIVTIILIVSYLIYTGSKIKAKRYY